MDTVLFPCMTIFIKIQKQRGNIPRIIKDKVTFSVLYYTLFPLKCARNEYQLYLIILVTKDEESEKMESTTEHEHSEIENTTNEQTETIETITQSKSLSEDVKNKIKTVLHMFRNKLSCKSKYLSEEVLNLPDIKDRKTEMMVRYCKVLKRF